MALDRSDLWARLLGFLFFLPILIPVLTGYPHILIGTGFAAIWVVYEACTLLGRGVSALRRILAICLMMGVFLLPILSASNMISSPLTIAIMAGLSVGAYGLLGRGEAVFMLLLAATIYCLSYLSVRPDGAFMLISLAIIISASDIGAYFSGRMIGGPKLAPAFSPSKTWAGSIGGILFALIAAEAALYGFWQMHLSAALGVLVVGLAILSQIGDLYESAMKRRLGIKDSGQLVPGHGGALDRFDGYMTTLPVAAWVLASDIALLGNLQPQ